MTLNDFLTTRPSVDEVNAFLADKNPAVINNPDRAGNSPLIDAVELQLDDVAMFLVDRGADIRAKDSLNASALYYACQSGSLKIVRRLLDLGAEVDEKRSDGWTPLLAAFSDASRFRRDSLRVAEIREGKDIEIRDPAQIRELAGEDRYQSFPAIIELLLNKGANVNDKTTDAQTGLHLAASNGDTELTRIALARGIDVNARDRFGLSALHFACRNGHLEIVKVLVLNGANPDAQENYGFTSLHEACENRRKDIAAFLLAKGADPAIGISGEFDPYPKGVTAKDIAGLKGYDEIVALFS